jgi:Tol biopolymer transport system component
MATGRQAFAGDTAVVIHQAILQREPTQARQLVPETPLKLEAIINKALEKDRKKRYQTAAALRADLGQLKRETDSERNALHRRWPLWLAGSLAVILAGLAAAWFAWRRVGTLPELTERQVTANPLEDWVKRAAISPDGQYVAYVDQTGFYLRSIDSGETRAVSLPAGFQSRLWGVQWFPDGGKLIAEVGGSGGFDLWVIGLLGEAAPHLLYRHGVDPAISPDGRMIAFVSREYGKPSKEVLIGGISGETPRELVAAQEDQTVASPVWSPDGHWIAYRRDWKTAQGSDSSAIEVRAAGGGPAKTLVSESSLRKSSSPDCWSGGCLTWLPDWRLAFAVREVFTRSETVLGRNSLWDVRVELQEGEAADKPERLKEWDDFAPQDLTITADGKRLAFLKMRQWQDVYVGELSPDGTSMKPPHRFTLDNRGSYPNSWTDDSQAIVFSSDRNGKSEVFRQGLNESFAEAAVKGPRDDYDARLSPDRSWMLYRESTRATHGASPSSPDRLMRRPAAGGSPEMVLEEPATVGWGYSCPLKRGAACVLSEKEGKQAVFYSLDPVRGKGDRLGTIEVGASRWFNWGVSSDGSRLASIDELNHKGRIEVLTLFDRAWHEVSLETGWGELQSIAWAADGKGFFVTSWLPDSFNLLHVTLAGKVKPLLRNGHRQWMARPMPSPDGKHLAYQAQTWDSNVWMLEGF